MSQKGIAFSLLFEALYPGKLQLSNFKFTECTDYDKVQNLEILKNGLMKANIPVDVDFDKISRNSSTEIYRLLLWLYEEYHHVDRKPTIKHLKRPNSNASHKSTFSNTFDAKIRDQRMGHVDDVKCAEKCEQSNNFQDKYVKLLDEAIVTSDKLNASLHETLGQQEIQLRNMDTLMSAFNLQQNKLELIQQIIEEHFTSNINAETILDIIKT